MDAGDESLDEGDRFLVLPSLGFGVFGAKGPPELKLFTSSVLNHLFCGLGLWWTCGLLGLVLRAG